MFFLSSRPGKHKSYFVIECTTDMDSKMIPGKRSNLSNFTSQFLNKYLIDFHTLFTLWTSNISLMNHITIVKTTPLKMHQIGGKSEKVISLSFFPSSICCLWRHNFFHQKIQGEANLFHQPRLENSTKVRHNCVYFSI